MSNAFLTRLSAILIIIIALLLYYTGCMTKKKNKEIDKLHTFIAALNDTLKLVKHSDSSNTASIKAFASDKVEDLLVMKIKDSTINALQDVVSKYKKQLKTGGTAVVIKGETDISSNSPTIIEYTNYDTVPIPIFPIYKSVHNNKWYTIKTKANKDSTYIDLKVTNSYDVVVSKEKGEWVADVTNHNPYSSTKSMRAYNVEIEKVRQKRINLAVFGGYGFTMQGQVRGAPIIGAGISYTILSLF